MRDVTERKVRANSWLMNNDAFGFSLLPAGSKTNDFVELGGSTGLWSTSENGSTAADYFCVDGSIAGKCGYPKSYMLSVRCLKD